jgi:hypothetical protein
MSSNEKGDEKMKKISLFLITLLIVAFLIMLSVPAHASQPSKAEGLWQYTTYILEAREAGCNTFLTTFEESVWSGTFEGTSTEDGKVVIHCSGKWSFKAIVTFDQVTVKDESGADRSGTLEMSAVGSRPDGSAEWFGQWVITDGTDGLKNLHGQGNFWGPGAPDVGVQGDIYYDGNYHFEPN